MYIDYTLNSCTVTHTSTSELHSIIYSYTQTWQRKAELLPPTNASTIHFSTWNMINNKLAT